MTELKNRGIADRDIVRADLRHVVNTLHSNETFNAIQQEVSALTDGNEDDIDKAYRALIEESKNHDPSLSDHGCKIPELVGLIGFELKFETLGFCNGSATRKWARMACKKTDK